MPAPVPFSGLDAPSEAFSRVAAGIAALGAALRVNTEPLLDRLTVLAPELAQYAMIAVTSAFDRIVVTTPLARAGDSMKRAHDLVAGADPEQPRRAEQLADRATTALHFDAESLPGEDSAIAIGLAAFSQQRALATDLARLADFGVPQTATTALAEAATALGARLIGVTDRAQPAEPTPDRAWTLTFQHDNRTDDARAATLAHVLATAESLGATVAQRSVVEGLHAAFAHECDSFSFLRVRPAGLDRSLGVTWSNVPWEHVVRVMRGFYPHADAPTKLGQLAGIFDAPAAAAVDIVLGPSEPPRMRVATTLTKGRTSS